MFPLLKEVFLQLWAGTEPLLAPRSPPALPHRRRVFSAECISLHSASPRPTVFCSCVNSIQPGSGICMLHQCLQQQRPQRHCLDSACHRFPLHTELFSFPPPPVGWLSPCVASHPLKALPDALGKIQSYKASHCLWSPVFAHRHSTLCSAALPGQGRGKSPFAHIHLTFAFLHATTSKAPASCSSHISGVFSPEKRSTRRSREISSHMLSIPTLSRTYMREYKLSCLSICPFIHLSFQLSLYFMNTLFLLILFPLLTQMPLSLPTVSFLSMIMLVASSLLYHSPPEGLIPCGLFSPSGQSHIHGWQLRATARGVRVPDTY